LNANDPPATLVESNRWRVEADRGTASARVAKRQPLGVQPAVALAEARLDDVGTEVRKAVAGFVAAQEFDVRNPPPVQRVDKLALVLRTRV
jgi:hypothetical protein